MPKLKDNINTECLAFDREGKMFSVCFMDNNVKICTVIMPVDKKNFNVEGY